MAQPKHILTGKEPEKEAPLLMENLRELSDQMTLENLAGETLTLNDNVILNSDGLTVNDSEGIPRVLIGRDIDGFGTDKDYGIKVSQEGKDVLNCEDNELIMSSAFNSFKIVQTGTVSLTLPASTTFIDAYIDHSLGYPPMVMGFFSDGSTTQQLPYTEWTMATGAVYSDIFMYSSATQIRILWRHPATLPFSSTRTVRYYILAETAKTT